MPKVHFFEGRESGVPDSFATLFIHDAGELPVIPFQWDGKTCSAYNVTSRKTRSLEQGDRLFQGIIVFGKTLESGPTGEKFTRVIIVWVRERNEWVAYRENWSVGRADNHGFRDEYVSFEGPWSLDDTHKRAILAAHNVQDKFDVSKANRISPLKFQCSLVRS